MNKLIKSTIKSTGINRCDFLYLISIWVVGLALTLIFYYFSPLFSRDGAIYLKCAEALAQEDGFLNATVNTPQLKSLPPLFMFLMGQLIKLGIEPIISGIVISIFCGTLTPIIVFFMGFALSGKKSFAYSVAILALANPQLAMFSRDILRESMYLCFSGLFLLFIIYFIQKRCIVFLYIAGGIMPLAILTRLEAAEFILILFFCITFCLSFCQLKKVLLYAGVCLLVSITSFYLIAFVLIGLPYDYFNYYFLRLNSLC